MTMPSLAATERKPVIINSLPRITTTTHDGPDENTRYDAIVIGAGPAG